MAKHRNLNIRLDDAEYQRVSEAADEAGRTRSDYVRELLGMKLSRRRKDRTAIELSKMSAELGHAGRNLNQSLKHIHEDRKAGTLTDAQYRALYNAVVATAKIVNTQTGQIDEALGIR